MPIWVSSVGTGLSYSTLDNPRNPTSGLRTQSNVEFAGLGGAAKFARAMQDTRYYHQIAGDVVGMVRAQSGYATPWGGQSLPLLDGFFGGPQLIRGFAPNGFGPRDITPGTTQDNLGGNVYWTTTAELQAPMPLVAPVVAFRLHWFFPAMMVLLGAHYLPFTFLYGMRSFIPLSALLVTAGVAIALWFPAAFSLGGWTAGLILRVFAFVGRAEAARQSAQLTASLREDSKQLA